MSNLTPPQPMESIPSTLEPYLRSIHRAIEQSLDDRTMPENLREAARYALQGGKYLRPLLCVLSAEACGASYTHAVPASLSLEYIHAFSLAHDDLPAMDDDDLRRGRPTLHRQFDEAMAILAGDALHAIAFELLCHPRYSAAQQAQLIRELAYATNAMIAGQVYDTLGGMSDKLSDRAKLETIHRNKTGALLCGACRMGGVVAEADAVQLERLKTYGASVGLMFQIVDDLIDVEQSPEHTGKATGKDKHAGKLTFPGLLGVEASREAVSELLGSARDALSSFGERGLPLLELAEFLAIRTR